MHLLRHATPSLLLLALAGALLGVATVTGAVGREASGGQRHEAVRPLIIGHRGAPGYRPEHTLASYELAVRMGPSSSSRTW